MSVTERTIARSLVPFATPSVRAMNGIGTSMKRAPLL
jgi:hypothetical protein